MGALENEFAEIQQLILSLEEDLQTTIVLADEDGVVTPEEKELIAYARGQVDDAKRYSDELAAEMAKAKGEPGQLGENPEGAPGDPAKAAWKAFSSSYRNLLGIYSDMKDDGHALASDLGDFLDEIQVAVAEENWEEALNQGVLAASWADDNDLYEEYQQEVDDEDEDEDSGKEAWDQATEGRDIVAELNDMQSKLKDLGNEHAAKLGEFIAKIGGAVDDEDWNLAIQQLVLCYKFMKDNKLIELVEDEEDYDDSYDDEDTDDSYDNRDGGGDDSEEDEDDSEDDEDVVDDQSGDDPGRTAWEGMSKVYGMIKDLYATLGKADHPLENRIGSYLDEMDAAVKDEEWDTALSALAKAGKFADENDLWDVEEPDEGGGDIISADHKKKLQKLKDLHRDLDFLGHEKAKELGGLIDDVPEKVTSPMDMIPADRALQRAYEFADKHKLWDAQPGLTKAEEEKLFWENNGENYKKVKGLLSDLEFENHEYAADIDKILTRVDKNIKDQTYFAASMGIDQAIDLADEENLWDVRIGLPKSEEEELFWEHHGDNYRKVKKLFRRLEDVEHEDTKALGKIIAGIDKNIKDATYFAATMGIDQAIELADENKLWDETPKEVWDALQKDVEKLRKLFGALYDAGHEAADQIGDLIDAMDDARRGEDWEDAERQYAAAKALADGLKLWDAVKTEEDHDDDEEEDVDPLKAAWEARRPDYDKIVEIHDRLIRETHPDSVEIGSMITSIADAVDDEYWQDAEKFLDIAIQLAKSKKHWESGGEPEEPGGINPATASISGSVGQGGKNRAADVETVQLLLNEKGATLEPDGACGKLTIGAIKKFQQSELGWKDGRVDPGGKTWAALTGGAISDVVDKVKDVVDDVSDTISDAAGKIADKASDLADDVTDFFEDLFDDDDDDKSKSA